VNPFRSSDKKKFRSGFVAIIPLVLSFLFLSCNSDSENETLPPEFVTVKDIKAEFDQKAGAIHFLASAEFNNPNDQNLLITGHELFFYLDGTRIGKAKQIDQRLTAGKNAVVNLKVTATVEGVLMAMDAMVKGNLADIEAGIAIRGPITFARDTFRFDVEIVHDQVVKLPAIQ